jgi:hypothetical protein
MHLRLMCFFDRHVSTRNRVKWDGLYYQSLCKKCGQPIQRERRQSWRRIPVKRIEHKES